MKIKQIYGLIYNKFDCIVQFLFFNIIKEVIFLKLFCYNKKKFNFQTIKCNDFKSKFKFLRC